MRYPAAPPSKLQLVSGFEPLPRLYPHMRTTTEDGRYLHWDELRRKPPPGGLNHSEWWTAQKLARLGAGVVLRNFKDAKDGHFWFCRLDAIDRATHEIDRRDAAREMLEALGDEAARYQYRFDQLIEEAINSSVLEGATLTTRAQASAMIRENRQPTSRGERMVKNNYLAMKHLLDITGNELSKRSLTLDDLLEIHAILGDDTLDSPNAEGRLRSDADHVRVEDATTGEVWFTPIKASELPNRINELLEFANQDGSSQFLHPLIRAIVVHFWLAYLHPFADGNGRMARALFYWQMLRSGYDFAQYLSISGPIDRAPKAYYLAFAYTETDENDLTYFILHQLDVLRKATDELIQHLRERSSRLRNISLALASAESLNHRQQSVLAQLVRNPHQGVTLKGHSASMNVTYLTARKDLQELEAAGMLRRVRVGRGDRYLLAAGLPEKIEQAGDRATGKRIA